MEDATKPEVNNDSQKATSDATKGNDTQSSGGMSVDSLAKRIEDMEKRLADKDAHITELANERAVLEQRLSSIGNNDNAEKVEDVGQPNEKFIRADQIPVIFRQQVFIEKVREENKDLIDLGLEPSIELRARQFLAQGKDFETSISQSVKEHREKVEKIKAPVVKPVPNGAVGEDGSVKAPVEPKKEANDSIEDEGQARYERRMRLGL